jgi:hypothetical protein
MFSMFYNYTKTANECRVRACRFPPSSIGHPKIPLCDELLFKYMKTDNLVHRFTLLYIVLRRCRRSKEMFANLGISSLEVK